MPEAAQSSGRRWAHSGGVWSRHGKPPMSPLDLYDPDTWWKFLDGDCPIGKSLIWFVGSLILLGILVLLALVFGSV